MSKQNSYFLATPIHDGRVHHAYMTGAVQMSLAAPGQFIVSKLRGSYLPASRDLLTHNFLRSNASHMLCVDPDIGWDPSHVQALAQANKDFIAGIYALKQPDRAPSVHASAGRDGDLIEVTQAGPGFLLLTRSCVERLVAAHPELIYASPSGPVCAIWSPHFEGKPYADDASFCARFRALGGKLWAHTRVVLKRYGDSAQLPRGFAAP